MTHHKKTMKTQPALRSATALLALATLLYQPTTCHAQGTAFTYQGRLNDGGTPANGSYDLRFALFDAASAGTQQGATLTTTATAVSNGLFTVTLDFGNQFPGADRWLEIGVRTNSGSSFSMLTPRQKPTTTPYAIYAGSSATLATASNQPVTLTANGIAVLHLESVFDSYYGSTTVNSLGGSAANVISNGFVGGFIGGGGNSSYPNRVGADYASVLGGLGNTAHGEASTAMGRSTTASGFISTAMGQSTKASGFISTALGFGTIASGDYSFAGGRQAKAPGNGSFVWADSTGGDFGYPGNNKFQVRATGGVLFYADPAANTGVYLAPGGNSWSATSDRIAKENFREINPQEILAKVAALPVLDYNLKSQDQSIRHLGPMAQDFAAAFHLGEDDKHITTIDADGVALAAIQGLNEKVEIRSQKSEGRIQKLETENADLKMELANLKRMVEKLGQPRKEY